MIDGNINFTGSLSGSIEGGGGEGTNNYNELINKPSINGTSLVGNKTTSQLGLFDGDYTNLTNKPSINGTVLNGAQTSQTLGIFDGDYNNLTNKPSIPSGDYDDLIDKPSINNVTLAGNRTAHDLGLFDGDYNNLTNKPNLAEVATTGSYDDLNNKPTIPPAQVNSDWNVSSGVAQILNKPSLATVATSGSYEDLTNKPTIPPAQVNADWDASSGVAQILNKPSLATVATSGNYTDLINKPTADDIQYDTTNSVADEISEINSSLTQYMTWKVFYDDESFTRGVAKPLPTTWNELWVTIQVDGSSTNLYQFYILKHYTTARNYMMGYTLSASMTFAQIGITPSNNTIMVGDLRNNGTQINATNVTLLYR